MIISLKFVFQLQDYDDVRQVFDKGVALPFNVNNVDVTVAANVVYGITMATLTNITEQPKSLIDADVEVRYTLCNLNSKWAAAWQNQQNDLCAQRRLTSSWASAQFDQSLRFPHEETMGP